jgi:anaerobic magnesium-protoporphyrin IX monomethyl ester cyclase
MKKKVALINPGSFSWASIHPPFNLGFIAAYLEKNGVEVEIIDELAGQNVEKALKRMKPDIAGVTATTVVAPAAYRALKLAKQLGITTVMGGVHASIMHEEALANGADMVVSGEGEQAMLEIVNGRLDRLIRNDFVKNLDDIPPPAWHLFDMEFYLATRDRIPRSHINLPVPKGTKIGALITSRGCPYQCIFCYNSWRDTPCRFNSAERVMQDIETLVRRYGTKALFFIDDNLPANRPRLKRICEELIARKYNLVWGCQATANSVNDEILQLMKQAGCRQICFGFESGSQKILDILKKKTQTVEQNARAAEVCNRAGIPFSATFMIGNPEETIEDIKLTFEFIRRNSIPKASILIATPFPGTELWEWCKGKGLIPEKTDWSKFSTGEISIPCNDTIPPRVIQKLRDDIQNYFHPISLMEALTYIPKRPDILLRALKDPKAVLSALFGGANKKELSTDEVFKKFLA